MSSSGAVLIRGRRIAVTSCEFAYASGSVVALDGSDNRIVNCYIHDGNYAGKWKGRRLGPRDYVLSADEKPNIQILERCHPTVGPAPGRPALVEHEYERHGVLAYLAAWDVRRARLGPPCLLDHGQRHRSPRRTMRPTPPGPLAEDHPRPSSHPCELAQQIEIYFSVVQRKVLTRLDCASGQDLTDLLLRFQDRYEEMARPFEWKFTRRELDALLVRLEHLPAAA